MKKLTKHYKKTLILLSVFFWFIIFILIYSFYPVINYDTKYSKHNNGSEAPWNIVLYDRNWKLITDKMYKNWYYKFIKINNNSRLVKSILKIEDKNYYNHYWINFLSKLRAIKDNLSWKKISGWSTIIEQYIKNKYFKSEKRTYLQKLRETVLAIYFNLIRTKENILNIYCHDVYLWNHNYWIWAAIDTYFKKDKIKDLTDEEITILISLIHNPSIKYLEEENFLNYFNKVKKRLNFNFERTYFWKLNSKKNIDKFPFVTNLYLKKILTEGFNPLLEKTTIDSELQQYTKELIERTLDNFEWKNVTNSAIFAIIPWNKKIKKEPEILIYQGSRDFYSKIIDWQVNVIDAKRQPWSTVKPFLYLQALELWYNPDDLLVDLVSEYNSFQKWKIYISENYSLKEFWLLRFKKALWNSINNASVRLGSELWLEKVYEYYKTYWFEFDYDARHYWYSLVLWNAETTLRKLVENYSKLLWNDKNKFLLQDILSDPDNRDISFWVNSILNTSIPQAVKTGTSSDFRDNWVISYHPDLILWVWVGNNDNSSMIWVTWITWAWSIWHNIIEKAIELWYIKNRNLEIPKSITESEYCLDKNCFEKELIYKKNWVKYFSRIKEWFYSQKDLKEKLSEFEIDKLKKMWIILK
jgi:membrane carboxypeptidase/penicillin-binding protein